MSKSNWYLPTVDRISGDPNRDQYLANFAIKMLSPEKQFIVRKRFIEGQKDSEVMKLIEKDFGVIGNYKYQKLRDDAISELSKIFGFQAI